MRIAIVVATEPGIKPLGLGGNFEVNLKRAVEIGYDGVELLVGELDQLNAGRVRRLVDKYGLSIPAIETGPTYTVHGLSLASSDKEIRKRAVERVKDYLNFGKELDSPVIVGSVKGWVEDPENGVENLKSCLGECADFAEECGTGMLIEPLNRYESNVINTLEEAVTLVKEIGSHRVRVMADTFHMNIEEKSICDSMMRAKEYLAYVHFSDSNRRAPGQGHLDFKKIISVLQEIGYENFIAAEILPLPNQYEAAKLAIEYLKRVMPKVEFSK